MSTSQEPSFFCLLSLHPPSRHSLSLPKHIPLLSPKTHESMRALYPNQSVGLVSRISLFFISNRCFSMAESSVWTKNSRVAWWKSKLGSDLSLGTRNQSPYVRLEWKCWRRWSILNHKLWSKFSMKKSNFSFSSHLISNFGILLVIGPSRVLQLQLDLSEDVEEYCVFSLFKFAIGLKKDFAIETKKCVCLLPEKSVSSLWWVFGILKLRISKLLEL